MPMFLLQSKETKLPLLPFVCLYDGSSGFYCVDDIGPGGNFVSEKLFSTLFFFVIYEQ